MILEFENNFKQNFVVGQMEHKACAIDSEFTEV